MGQTNGNENVVIVDAAGNVLALNTPGSAVSGKVLLVAGTDGTNARTILTDTAGRVKVDGAYTPGSTAPTSAVGVVAASDGTNGRLIATDTGGRVKLAPDTAGGLTPSRIVTGTTGFIKNSAGQVYGLDAYNANAALRYLHLYNKASAPTLSTDTPVWTIPIAGSSAVHIPMAAMGAAFGTGIAWAYTTDDVAIPTTAGTSAELHFTLLYA